MGRGRDPRARSIAVATSARERRSVRGSRETPETGVASAHLRLERPLKANMLPNSARTLAMFGGVLKRSTPTRGVLSARRRCDAVLSCAPVRVADTCREPTDIELRMSTATDRPRPGRRLHQHPAESKPKRDARTPGPDHSAGAREVEGRAGAMPSMMPFARTRACRLSNRLGSLRSISVFRGSPPSASR